MEAGFYLVGTPIGNLEDMSYRAVRTLSEVDLILAEDTRVSGVLLRHYDIRTPLKSCHGFNERSRVDEILEVLSQGKSVALISDAGMPVISDPGGRMVRAVREAGYPVTAVPGPTAAATALALSGWGENGWLFQGFVPNKSAGRRRLLETLRDEPRTVVLYESTHRIRKLLSDLQEIHPERSVFIGRELTKKFETCVEGAPEELAAFFETHSIKGEFVVILGPGSSTS
jgi:16S rRNA (cytidine1402-2'-O)-methyltransferase